MRLAQAEGSNIKAKEDMRALAARFPGALRELDRLTMTQIDERVRLLEESIEQSRTPPAWAPYACAYHGWMRGILKLRSLIGDERDVATALAILRAHYVAADDEPELSQFDSRSIQEILNPVEGRTNSWVFRRIAEEFGENATQVERAIFDF
jgi:hypothetical protein